MQAFKRNHNWRMEESRASICIRDAQIEDARRIGEIVVDAWQYAYSGFLSADFMASRSDPRVRAQRVRDRWGERMLRLVAVDETGEVIGFAIEARPCSVTGIDAEIGALYVDPKFGRSGAGTALVKAMVQRFLKNGARSMAIHTLAQNKIGCSFYEKIGGLAGPSATWNDIPSRWYIWPELAVLGDGRDSRKVPTELKGAED